MKIPHSNAVVLVSGGLDSTTCIAMAKCRDFDIHALTFRYGQKHIVEVAAAKKIAKHFDVKRHIIIDIDVGIFGESALTSDEEVPKNRGDNEMASGIPSTYVPARNTLFLSYALAYSEANQISDIFVGVNTVDYSGYP